MNMLEVGVMLKLTDQMTGGMRNAMGSLDSFGGKLDQISEKATRMGRASLANGMIGVGLLEKPIRAYADLDDAMATLEVAMMQKGAHVGTAFNPLKSQIVELGNKLPGTTADFAQLATTMISLGIPAEKLLGGALDAASNLKVVLKMTSEAAGETVVKMREAYNLNDSELAKTADIAQRAKFAFGLKPEDLRVAASYQSAQLNILHLRGAENMQKMLVMQGMANLKGLDGSSFGTNMSMMLTRLATGPKMLEMAHKGMKGVGKDILDDLKIKFEFFDKKGNFRGLEAMVKEFEKFKIIEAKYHEQGVSEVSNALFGIEAARPAMILAEYGQDGFTAAQKRFAEQASLQERIDRYLKTTENVWKAFTGTLTNLMAGLAGPAIESLKSFINRLNEITGGPLMKWVDENKMLVEAGGKLAIGFAALAVVVGGAALAVGALARVTSLLGIGKAGGALSGVANGLKPIPVFVVNQPGLLPGSGLPDTSGPGGAARKLSKMEIFGGFLKGVAVFSEGYAFGSLIYSQLDRDIQDAIGRAIAAPLAFFGNQSARDALAVGGESHKEMLTKRKQHEDIYGDALFNKTRQIEIHLHTTVDAQGRATHEVTKKSSGFGLSFNAHAGQTMVTP